MKYKVDKTDIMKNGQKKVNLLIGTYDNRKHHRFDEQQLIKQAQNIIWLGDEPTP